MKQYLTAIFVACSLPTTSMAQLRDSMYSNYHFRRAIVVNTAPHLLLGGFSFENTEKDRLKRFEISMRWKNVTRQPITAFEIVILKYDAFNRRLTSERWTVTGKNSANWVPLQPGESSEAGRAGIGEELVFTAIAYICAVRLVDDTVWEVNPAQLLVELKKAAPGFKDYGSLEPDSKAKNSTQ